MSMAGITEVSLIKTFLIALLSIIKEVRVRLLTHKDKCDTMSTELYLHTQIFW